MAEDQTILGLGRRTAKEKHAGASRPWDEDAWLMYCMCPHKCFHGTFGWRRQSTGSCKTFMGCPHQHVFLCFQAAGTYGTELVSTPVCVNCSTWRNRRNSTIRGVISVWRAAESLVCRDQRMSGSEEFNVQFSCETRDLNPAGQKEIRDSGVASMTVPVYIAEVAPPHLRGRLVTINTLFITGGQFFASVVDGLFSYLAKDGWRYMLGLSAVPAVIQFLGFLFLPESPRWLIQKGQTQRARRILSQMRGNQAIDEEYDSIKNNIEEEEKEVGAAGPVICRMLTYPPTRRALIVGCGLQMFQQLSGINTVMYYSATILQMSGVEDDRLAIWLAALTAFINFIFTLVGVWLVERMGRRKLTLGSLTGTAVALIILASGFLLSAQVSPRITLNPPDPSHQNSTCTKYSYCNGCMLDPDCGLCYKLNKSSVVESSCIPVDKDSTMKAAWGRCSNETVFKKEDLFWAYNFCPTPYSWTALLGLILYLVFFAPGMGPMPWTINSEIYPLWARSTGNACSSGVNWVFNVLVSLTFLHAAEYLTYYGAFFLYAGFAGLGLVFIYGCLPETKGKKLEEIESLFESRLCTCGVSDSDEGRYIEYIRVKGSNYHLSDNDASDVE
nr:proton myo-inositol cotransporter isoform X2 [Columba livia]XP_021156997.1 proton myo-inositol cotransporter isoform X2 [Columba livia]